RASLSATAVYNDEIVPVDKWPGTSALYDFTMVNQTPTLSIRVSFDPEQAQHRRTALDVYSVVADQLVDTRSSLSVTTAMAAGPVVLASADGASMSDALEKFVLAVVAYLTDSKK